MLPAVENGDITGINPGAPDRVDRWIQTAISVRDWPRWIFVKVHSHGTQEDNSRLLLSPVGMEMYQDLLDRYNDGHRYERHFVTAWQMYGCVRALESADDEAIRCIEDFQYPCGGGPAGSKSPV